MKDVEVEVAKNVSLSPVPFKMIVDAILKH
jgi:hypothetical protein